MKQSLVHVALVVDDYDDAIAFYTNSLGFELVEDTYIEEQDKRWVLVSPPGGTSAAILLVQADSDTQNQCVGNQAGGRVFLFLGTDDIWRDYKRYVDAGVKFVREPVQYDYGTVAVFQDLYGNLWDLLEHADGHRYSQK
ncbi:MAG: VOC family protein [Halioglobus sp.]